MNLVFFFDPIPSSPNKHRKDCTADSKEKLHELLGVKGLRSIFMALQICFHQLDLSTNKTAGSA